MRLIDADELDIYDVSPAYGMCVMGVTQEDIDDAPTIDMEKFCEKMNMVVVDAELFEEMKARYGRPAIQKDVVSCSDCELCQRVKTLFVDFHKCLLHDRIVEPAKDACTWGQRRK